MPKGATEIGAVASRHEFRYKSGVVPAAAEVALRAGSFRGRTGRYVHGCDRCANFEPLGVERRRLQPEECHHHCRLRGDHRAGQDGLGVMELALAEIIVEGKPRVPRVV